MSRTVLKILLFDLGLDLLDRRHQVVADAVAQEIILQVGRVLVEFQASCAPEKPVSRPQKKSAAGG